MGILTEAFHPTPVANWSPSSPPTHDGWFVRDISGFVAEAGGAGVSVNADTIMRCSTVLGAVRFRANSWAMCPPQTFAVTKRGRQQAPGHYSQRVLRKPNTWMTGYRWRQMNGGLMATWGNAYNEIKGGRSSFAEQLWPMHPSRVSVVDQRADGTLLYEYNRPEGGKPDLMGQERVLHFRDLSLDGMSGLEMFKLIRNVVGIAMLAEKHASTFLRKGTRISGLLVPTGVLGETERAELAESVNASIGGAGSTGALGILPHGVDLKPLSLSTKESQVLEMDDHALAAILRFLGVPGILVGYSKDLMGYASAKEFYESGGIRHCVLPILENVESEEEDALLIGGGDMDGDGIVEYQIKHNLDVLMRANTKDRYEALFKAIGGPFMTVNEGRKIEDMDPSDDPKHDEILTPSNMMGGDAAEPDEPPAPPAPKRSMPPIDDDDEQASAAACTVTPSPASLANYTDTRLRELARQFAHDTAAGIVVFEVSKVRAQAPKLARNKDGWKAFVLELYGGHAAHVAKKMRIDDAVARGYCDRQAAALLAGGVGVIEAWDVEIPPQLAALALEGE